MSYYRIAITSAARTAGCFVLAFRIVRTILASLKPAVENSSRNAPALLAPAIHENQLALPDWTCSGNLDLRISSAANT